MSKRRQPKCTECGRFTMSSAPRKGWAPNIIADEDMPPRHRAERLLVPVLAFDTEGERDGAALAIVDFDQSAADYKRMRTRLQEAEALLAALADDLVLYHPRADCLGAARRFLQGDGNP